LTEKCPRFILLPKACALASGKSKQGDIGRVENKDFDFWQDHSDQFLEMAFRHDRRERVAEPDAFGKKTGDCGDTVAFYLVVRNGKIRHVAFELDGCIHTNACANTVAHLAEGCSIEQAWEISPETVSDFLKTLPPDHYHCAELTVGAFYLALANFRELRRDSWKKSYLK
jgi:nitrogen fixation NifU-like protein